VEIDIRTLIGTLFSLIGAVLVAFGAFFSNSAIYEKSLGNNVNLTWGCVLLFFGILMISLGRRR
jgi:hypothetical protein